MEERDSKQETAEMYLEDVTAVLSRDFALFIRVHIYCLLIMWM